MQIIEANYPTQAKRTEVPGGQAASSQCRCECQVQFPFSSLPHQYRRAFLIGMEYRVLRELGEAQPLETKLLLQTPLGSHELDSSSAGNWDGSTAMVRLEAVGPHARELSAALPDLVATVLSTLEFDQDGFVISR